MEKFADLECKLFGVYGNNDKYEIGLDDVAKKNGFKFVTPPLLIRKQNRNIAVFHEPEIIEDYLKRNSDIDIVLHGHTHRYRREILNEVLFFNPGESAGMLEGKNAVGLLNLNDLSTEIIFF